jgi:hypothetical protein
MATGDHKDELRDPLQQRVPGAAAQARSMAHDAKETARSLLGEQQKAAASGIGDFAGALRKAARDMGDARQAPMSRMLEGAADGLERFSGSLREKDLNALMREVEGFARRQPVAFFGAAVAAGFLAIRFLKSSHQRDDNSLPY